MRPGTDRCDLRRSAKLPRVASLPPCAYAGRVQGTLREWNGLGGLECYLCLYLLRNPFDLLAETLRVLRIGKVGFSKLLLPTSSFLNEVVEVIVLTHCASWLFSLWCMV